MPLLIYITLIVANVCAESQYYKGFYGQDTTLKLSGSGRAIYIKPNTNALVLSENGASQFQMKLLKPNPSKSAANRTAKDRVYLYDEFKLLFGSKSVFADPSKKQFVMVSNGPNAKYTRFRLTQKYATGCDQNGPEYEIMYQKENYNRNPDLCSFKIAAYGMCTGRCGKRVLWAYIDGTGWRRVGRDKTSRATWVALQSGWSNYEFDLPT